ncbi:MAG: hypothetical protein KDK53_00865 [Maritimibacter sp.]|nr:hypothetical protein [Sedimentitalea sp.]MCB1355096.1 hypothetical protein [Maritimibacter sp.]
MSDAFKDRLSERARETGRPALGNQCRGRPLTPAEDAFADALMAIYGTGQHDFTAVAALLAERAVVAPISGRTDWDLALLEAELKAINADLDAAYAEAGYGA